MNDYRTLKVKNKIHSTKIKVTGYTDEYVPVKRSCLVTLKHKGQLVKTQMLIVEKSIQPILGLSTCEKLDLLRRVFVVTSYHEASESSYMENYKDVFEGFGCWPGEHRIIVDKTVTPVVHACRKVPFALRGKLKEELIRMEKPGVIKKIDEPTDWVSSLVVVLKKNVSLKMSRSKRSKREHFKLPTREEIMSQFPEAKWFSKLDASSGFS